MVAVLAKYAIIRLAVLEKIEAWLVVWVYGRIHVMIRAARNNGRCVSRSLTTRSNLIACCAGWLDDDTISINPRRRRQRRRGLFGKNWLTSPFQKQQQLYCFYYYVHTVRLMMMAKEYCSNASAGNKRTHLRAKPT